MQIGIAGVLIILFEVEGAIYSVSRIVTTYYGTDSETGIAYPRQELA